MFCGGFLRLFFSFIFLGFISQTSALGEVFLEEPNPSEGIKWDATYKDYKVSPNVAVKNGKVYFSLIQRNNTVLLSSFDISNPTEKPKILIIPSYKPLFYETAFKVYFTGDTIDLYKISTGLFEKVSFDDNGNLIERKKIDNFGKKDQPYYFDYEVIGNEVFLVEGLQYQTSTAGYSGRTALVLHHYDLSTDSHNMNILDEDFGNTEPIVDVLQYENRLFVSFIKNNNVYFGEIIKNDNSFSFNPEMVGEGCGAAQPKIMASFDDTGNPAILLPDCRKFFIKTDESWNEETIPAFMDEYRDSTSAGIFWSNNYWWTVIRTTDTSFQTTQYIAKRTGENNWQIVYQERVEGNKSNRIDSGFVADNTVFFITSTNNTSAVPSIYKFDPDTSSLSLFWKTPYIRFDDFQLTRTPDGLVWGVIVDMTNNYSENPLSSVWSLRQVPSGWHFIIEKVDDVDLSSGYKCAHEQIIFDESGIPYIILARANFKGISCSGSSPFYARIYKFENGSWNLIEENIDLSALDRLMGYKFASISGNVLHIYGKKDDRKFERPEEGCPPWTTYGYDGYCHYQAIDSVNYNLDTSQTSVNIDIFKGKGFGYFEVENNLAVLSWIHTTEWKTSLFNLDDLSEVISTRGASSQSLIINQNNFQGAAFNQNYDVKIFLNENGTWNYYEKILCDDGNFICDESNCNDNLDNDGDGLFDEKIFEGNCANGIDNDEDGEVDEGKPVNDIVNDIYVINGMISIGANSIYFRTLEENKWYKLEIKGGKKVIADNGILNIYGSRINFYPFSDNRGPRIFISRTKIDAGTQSVSSKYWLKDIYLHSYCVSPIKYLQYGAFGYCKYINYSTWIDYNLSGDTSDFELQFYTGGIFRPYFYPQSKGEKTLNLEISTVDPLNPTYNVEIKGRTYNQYPEIHQFYASPLFGNVPLTTTFNWNVSDSDGDTLTCYLDVDNDGNNDYTINDCANNTSQIHTYNNAGNYTAKLTVDDGFGGIVFRTINVNVRMVQYTLTVNKTGAGGGTVTSNPTGIDCGTDCSNNYDYGTSVTLTATPDDNSIFVSWSDDCSGCGNNTTCTITVDSNKTCTAQFDVKPNNLPVINSFTVYPNTGYAPLTTAFSWNVSDSDGDTLTCYLDVDNDGSNDYTINDCANNTSQIHTYNNAGNYTAKLTVDDGKGGTATQTISITVNELVQYTLTVNKTGTGSGTVTSNPAGINCGSDCSETYDGGTSITLTATPDGNSIFSGWGDDCSGCGTNATCTITIDSDKTCKAIFNTKPSPITEKLTVRPDRIIFGAVPVGEESRSRLIIISNDTSINIRVNQVTLIGTDKDSWEKSNDLCQGNTLSPGRKCVVRFRFKPQNIGHLVASVKIVDENGNEYYVSLEGTGTSREKPKITSDILRWHFGFTPVGECSEPVSLTIRNIGRGYLYISRVDLRRNKDSFSIVSDNCTNNLLPQNGTCSIEIKFCPTRIGFKSTDIKITSNDPHRKRYLIRLYGYGIR